MTTLTDIINFVRSGTKPFREWEKGVANRVMNPDKAILKVVKDFAPTFNDEGKINSLGGLAPGAMAGVTIPMASKLFNKSLYQNAITAQKQGKSISDIIDETETFLTRDSKGNPTAVQSLITKDADILPLTSMDPEKIYKLSEVVNYKPLYDLDPSLADVRVRLIEKSGRRGEYDPDLDLIGINPYESLLTSKDYVDNLFHEIDHAIQFRHGLGDGSTLSQTNTLIDMARDQHPAITAETLDNMRYLSNPPIANSMQEAIENIYVNAPGEQLSNLAELANQGFSLSQGAKLARNKATGRVVDLDRPVYVQNKLDSIKNYLLSR